MNVQEILPWVTLGATLVGAVAAYYGSRNAMTERLARLEARHEALTQAQGDSIDDLRAELRATVSDLRASISRLQERAR